MSEQSLLEGAPKLFVALKRFLTAQQLDSLAIDYSICAQNGGNFEAGMSREEGVSFNPRLARILSILIHDGRVRDIITLRAALYAGAASGSREGANLKVPSELKDAVSQEVIKGVIALDTIRHLHQTNFSSQERDEILSKFNTCPGDTPEWLQKKLEHAILLQRRGNKDVR
jgi:hypothetical protein